LPDSRAPRSQRLILFVFSRVFEIPGRRKQTAAAIAEGHDVPNRLFSAACLSYAGDDS
jgi:hypothetical protein